jgi:hypothetical protein
MDEPFVVKVVRTSSTFQMVYKVYPEDGTWDFEVPLGAMKTLDDLMYDTRSMRGFDHKFFWACIDARGRLVLLTQIPCNQHRLW